MKDAIYLPIHLSFMINYICNRKVFKRIMKRWHKLVTENIVLLNSEKYVLLDVRSCY